MKGGLQHHHEEYGGRNDRTALIWLVHQTPDDYLPKVRVPLRRHCECDCVRRQQAVVS